MTVSAPALELESGPKLESEFKPDPDFGLNFTLVEIDVDGVSEPKGHKLDKT